jgi:hypothetical protein
VTCLLTLAPFSVPGAALADEPKEKAQPTASLTVLHDNDRYTEPLALVTLYREGKPVRSAKLKASSAGTARDNRVTWQKLPIGVYELHFEAAGFKKFVKKVVLAEDGPATADHRDARRGYGRPEGGSAGGLQKAQGGVAGLPGHAENHARGCRGHHQGREARGRKRDIVQGVR